LNVELEKARASLGDVEPLEDVKDRELLEEILGILRGLARKSVEQGRARPGDALRGIGGAVAWERPENTVLGRFVADALGLTRADRVRAGLPAEPIDALGLTRADRVRAGLPSEPIEADGLTRTGRGLAGSSGGPPGPPREPPKDGPPSPPADLKRSGEDEEP
jgi:hypothetical protein